MVAYWYFVVYVSPVLLVVVCAYLAWEAFKESRMGDADGSAGGEGGEPPPGQPPSIEAPPGEPLDGEEWRTDPDAWKGEP